MWGSAKRYGGLQGSPLVPADLRKVAAASAAATVIVSDSSRCADSDGGSPSGRWCLWWRRVSFRVLALNRRIIQLIAGARVRVRLVSEVLAAGPCCRTPAQVRSQRVPPPCRSPVEADAEAIRAAVLLDEIMQAAPEQSTARIVVVCVHAPQ
jgi:hypothetical protein